MANPSTNLTDHYDYNWQNQTPATYVHRTSDGRANKKYADWNCLVCATNTTSARLEGPKDRKDLCTDCGIIWYKYGTPTELKCDQCSKLSARTFHKINRTLCKLCTDDFIFRNFDNQQRRALLTSAKRVEISNLLNEGPIVPPAAADFTTAPIKIRRPPPVNPLLEKNWTCTSCKIGSGSKFLGPLGPRSLCQKCYRLWIYAKNAITKKYCSECNLPNSVKCCFAAPAGVSNKRKYSLCLKCFEAFIKSNPSK